MLEQLLEDVEEWALPLLREKGMAKHVQIHPDNQIPRSDFVQLYSKYDELFAMALSEDFKATSERYQHLLSEQNTLPKLEEDLAALQRKYDDTLSLSEKVINARSKPSAPAAKAKAKEILPELEERLKKDTQYLEDKRARLESDVVNIISQLHGYVQGLLDVLPNGLQKVVSDYEKELPSVETIPTISYDDIPEGTTSKLRNKIIETYQNYPQKEKRVSEKLPEVPVKPKVIVPTKPAPASTEKKGGWLGVGLVAALGLASVVGISYLAKKPSNTQNNVPSNVGNVEVNDNNNSTANIPDRFEPVPGPYDERLEELLQTYSVSLLEARQAQIQMYTISIPEPGTIISRNPQTGDVILTNQRGIISLGNIPYKTVGYNYVPDLVHTITTRDMMGRVVGSETFYVDASKGSGTQLLQPLGRSIGSTIHLNSNFLSELANDGADIHLRIRSGNGLIDVSTDEAKDRGVPYRSSSGDPLYIVVTKDDHEHVRSFSVRD